jgi:metallophosphoesterase superfamily enzyme
MPDAALHVIAGHLHPQVACRHCDGASPRSGCASG